MATQGGAGLQRTGRASSARCKQGSQCGTNVDPAVIRTPAASAPSDRKKPRQTAPGPVWPSISTPTWTRSPQQWDLPLHWDPNQAHASLTSRHGVVGALREEVPPRTEYETGLLDLALRGVTRKSRMLILTFDLVSSQCHSPWGWLGPPRPVAPTPLCSSPETRSSGSGSPHAAWEGWGEDMQGSRVEVSLS